MKKKTAARLLAALLALLFTPVGQVFAGNGDETLTLSVRNESGGHQYYAVQILKGDLSQDKTVLSNLEWGASVSGSPETFLAEIHKIEGFEDVETPQDLAEVLTEENIGAFSKVMYAHRLNGVPFSGQDEDGCYTVKVAPGYYMIIDEEGSLDGKTGEAYTSPVIQMTRDQTLVPKSAVPSLEKKVLEESYPSDEAETARYGESYNDVADYDIGDEISFRLFATLPENLESYETYRMIFQDQADAGLSFLRIDQVEVLRDGEVLFALDTQDYTLDQKDAQSFDLEIDDLMACFDRRGSEPDADATVRVTYTMRLTEDAVTGLPGQRNRASLRYSNNPSAESLGQTKEDAVVVFTYGLDASKVDAKDQKALEGAQFVLMKGDLYAKIEGGKIAGWTRDQREAGVLSSASDGTFRVDGIDAGEYRIKEIKAPDGYNLLKEPVSLTVTAQTENGQNWAGEADTGLSALFIEVGGEQTAGDTGTGRVALCVENHAGWTLPETGLSGKRLFLVSGALITATAVLLYIRQCRAK